MERQTISTQVDSALEYVLSRLATCYAQKGEYITRFIERGLSADGWFAIEALHNLPAGTASGVLRVEVVRGQSRAERDFNPDLQLGIDAQSHQLAIKSLVIVGGLDIPHYFAQEMPPLFRWLNDLPQRAALITISYPCAMASEVWTEAVKSAHDEHAVSVAAQMEFVVPRPPLPQVRATVALWRHASVVPGPETAE